MGPYPLSSGVSDISERHDDYLAEALSKET